MKKFIALLVCLLITLGLAACGGQPAAPKEEAVAAPAVVETQQAVETMEATEAMETTAAAETEAPTEATEEVPAFDTGWAGDEYVMPIPAPPFGAYWITYSEDQKLYIISDDSDTAARAGYDALAAYCEELKATGYVNIEKDVISADEFQTECDTIGASSMFRAANNSGYSVLVYQEERIPMVWVYCP